MDDFFRYWLRWPSIEHAVGAYSWGWPLLDTFHFVGLCLLIGIVGMYDLRVLGFAKGLPLDPLKRLLPWGVFGFVLTLITGLGFVLGIGANLYGEYAWDVIMRDFWLQIKLIFMALAGVNILVFYFTDVSRSVDALGPGDDAPPMAKAVAGASLFLWVGVMLAGRLIARGL